METIARLVPSNLEMVDDQMAEVLRAKSALSDCVLPAECSPALVACS